MVDFGLLNVVLTIIFFEKLELLKFITHIFIVLKVLFGDLYSIFRIRWYNRYDSE